MTTPGELRPADQVILGDIGLGEIGVDATGLADVGAGPVLEGGRLRGRLAIQLHGVGAIVRAVRQLRNNLVSPILSDVKRHHHFRAGALRFEEEQVLRPEHVLLYRDRAGLSRGIRSAILDLNLPRVADGQAPRAVGHLG